jgi:hypothetical protein
MCKRTQLTEKEKLNGNDKDIASRKQATMSIIGEVNELLKKNSFHDNLWYYILVMLFSVCAFVFLFVSTAKGKLVEIKDDQQLIYIAFCLIVESLLFIWWMKFLGKLLADARESMKAWRIKVLDTCSFLVDMETLLYKAEMEMEKKNIENKGKTPSAPMVEPNVENIVKKTIEAMMENKRKESTEVGWVVRIKTDE